MAYTSEEGGALGGPPHNAIHLLSAVVEGSSEAFVLVDRSGALHLINEGRPIAVLFDHAPSYILEHPLEFVEPPNYGELRDAYEAALLVPGSVERVDVPVAVAAGSVVTVRVTLINRLADDAIAALVVRLGLADEQRVYPRSPEDESSQHSWPGGRLPNKEAFMRRLGEVVALKDKNIWQLERVARAVVRDRRYDYSLILLELERFKMLLGGYGRDVLDELVEKVIAEISRVLRRGEVVAHFGGGEFGILLREGVAEQATKIADEVLDKLRRFEVAGQPISVVPVIGIATSERPYRTADEVVRDATTAASRTMG